MTDPYTRSTPTYRAAQATNQARGRPGFEVMPRPPGPLRRAWPYIKVVGAGVVLAVACVGMVVAWA